MNRHMAIARAPDGLPGGGNGCVRDRELMCFLNKERERGTVTGNQGQKQRRGQFFLGLVEFLDYVGGCRCIYVVVKRGRCSNIFKRLQRATSAMPLHFITGMGHARTNVYAHGMLQWCAIGL